MKYLSYILLLLLSTACKNNPTNSGEQNNVPLDNTKEKDTVILNKKEEQRVMCLDTIFLSKSNIKYHKQKTDFRYSNQKKVRRKWNWLIEVNQDDINQNLKLATYYYSSPIFFKDKCDKVIDYFELDSIQLRTSSNIQTLLFGGSVGLSIDDLMKTRFELVDLNFDGHSDLKMYLNLVSGATNEMSEYFIYNPNVDKYSNGLTITNLGIDTIKQELYNGWTGGHVGKIGARIWSEIFNYDSLRTNKSIRTDYIDSLSIYIQTKKELNGHNYTTIVDTILRN
ncbi:hypothetical protein N9L92_00545 [Saprospiraceae bacterium]|nr:hypothetical protein [Saprospiraceae bacterium]